MKHYLVVGGEGVRVAADSCVAHTVRLYLLRDRLFLMLEAPNNAVMVNGETVRRDRELRNHDELEISGSRGTLLQGGSVQL